MKSIEIVLKNPSDNRPTLNTALIGFGKISEGYAFDSAMAQYYPYSTHAQLLSAHPRFNWTAVVDPDIERQKSAESRWKVPRVFGDLSSLRTELEDIEVAVVATPPQQREGILEAFPNLKAVIIEKPISTDYVRAKLMVDELEAAGIAVQVNLWRRADLTFRRLADGLMAELIGEVQFAECFYGNGLFNNGIHLLDSARMLFGEVVETKIFETIRGFIEGPIAGDHNVAFSVTTDRRIGVVFFPLRFKHYRENGIIVWGSRGRLQILNEGLTMCFQPARENRAMSGERELGPVKDVPCEITVGSALYELYSNVAEHVFESLPLLSPGESALKSMKILEDLRASKVL